jgi:DNA/RNA endonuclease YhcR with UshA esterase domain
LLEKDLWQQREVIRATVAVSGKPCSGNIKWEIKQTRHLNNGMLRLDNSKVLDKGEIVDVEGRKTDFTQNLEIDLS